MRTLIGLIAVTLCLPGVARARPAERHWHCNLAERLDGAWVWVWQGYRGPDQPMGRPTHQVLFPADTPRYGDLGTIHFGMNSDGTWPSLDAPFAPPADIDVAFPLPERAASLDVTLYATGAAPVTGRVNRWFGSYGVTVRVRDRQQVLSLLTIRDWTAIVAHPDGRTQYVVPVRMPMGLVELRAQRERQVPRVREMGHEPATRCTAHDEAD
jgi:hypothetical protein